VKIAYVTNFDSRDIKAWSGTVYFIAKSLENQSISLERIGSLKENYSILFKSKQFFYQYLRGKNYFRHREPTILKGYAQQISSKLSGIDANIVFSPSTIPIAHLECQQPIVFWTDANFAAMVNYYPGQFSNLCQESIEQGNAMEQAVLTRCQLAIYSSDWAAQTAIENYRVEPSKVKVVPYGANIDCYRNLEDIKTIIESRSVDRCKLLFLGADWQRKGGDMAIAVTKQLNQAGLKTELVVVGCQPVTEEPLPNFIKPLGFISKSTEAGKEKINKLFAESHFLILPAKAECAAVVFSEANSFGVPCISTNTGGIPTIIKENLNGKTFPVNAKISEYCQYISDLMENYHEYRNLALSSFQEYQSRLNWSVAGQTVKKLMMELI
jgi:glycosyltransferase involved in cell wall biosynthesis